MKQPIWSLIKVAHMFKTQKKEREGGRAGGTGCLRGAQPLPQPQTLSIAEYPFSSSERRLSPQQLCRTGALEGYFCSFPFFISALLTKVHLTGFEDGKAAGSCLISAAEVSKPGSDNGIQRDPSRGCEPALSCHTLFVPYARY